jgi:hypothetical protein
VRDGRGPLTTVEEVGGQRRGRAGGRWRGQAVAARASGRWHGRASGRGVAQASGRAVAAAAHVGGRAAMAWWLRCERRWGWLKMDKVSLFTMPRLDRSRLGTRLFMRAWVGVAGNG